MTSLTKWSGAEAPEVIPIELRDAYAFGGGLHCCTADVYRDGELKDYFPKQ